ncbi:MAG: YihY/virulence factor BrkB family protein [Candidatus Nanopelagicales bacterium]
MRDRLDRIDAWTQRHSWLAFPIAVWKKFGDDDAGKLAALVAYYSFFGIFPLLLVMVTVLGIALEDNEELQQRVLDSALGQLPVIGDELSGDIGALSGAGLGLVIGLGLAFVGARGMASAMQYAANEVWDVPKADRPSGIKEVLRSLALLIVGAGGLVATSVLAGFMTGLVDLGPASRIAGLALSGLLNVGVFVLSFRIATASSIATRALLPGAIVAAAGWTVLQFFGTWLVTGQVERAGNTYGFFAIVIGLLTYLFIAAQMTLYALELSVVRERRLWPRSLFRSPTTAADQEVLTLAVHAEQRVEEQQIDVDFQPAEPAEHSHADQSDGSRHP